MSFCKNELYTEIEHPDGYNYKITVEDSMKGLARINIQCLPQDSDNPVNSQGADLLPEECRALAHMLIALAELNEKEAKSLAKRQRKT